MRGIAGVILRSGIPSDSLLYLLAKNLNHRGPDDMTGEIYDQVGFVHTRLSLIDLKNGNHPLHGVNLALSGTGSILNYKSLKKEFSSYPYSTKSDFEVIFPLYQKYAEDFANHLEGNYAIALYDNKDQKLFLMRDPFGKEPLYYWEGIHGFAFASEPQALLKANLLSPYLKHQNAYNLLALRYTWGRETLYEGIQRVVPGETIHIQSGHIQSRSLRQALPKGPPKKLSLEKSLNLVDKAINRSVKAHMKSQAPIGLFLSGDLDSYCLLKAMSSHTKDEISTFSIILSSEDKKKEEFLNSSKFKIKHTSVPFGEEDFWTLLPKVMQALDDPTLDIAAVPLYKMASEASKSVKVLLSSEGGDAIFGGYERYKRALWLWWFFMGDLDEKNPLENLDFLRMKLTSPWKERDEFIPVLKAQKFSRLQILQALDLEAYVPNDLLLKLDRCVMAHGVQARTPFLDLKLVEKCFNLPDKYKIQKKRTELSPKVVYRKNEKGGVSY